ncbi:hypothetical protein CVT26_010045 [Gymnopilus dilepis]|uniref:Uncharacterized protein n=1 Tax=Gymnopilus dilepis TaxID=231916 RepID=A0A409WTI2_9AGAR|nr:hypothetical protein CVT26_010045 [Gymnopilus dilepis]
MSEPGTDGYRNISSGPSRFNDTKEKTRLEIGLPMLLSDQRTYKSTMALPSVASESVTPDEEFV